MSGGYELEVRVRAPLDRFDLVVDQTIRHRFTGIFGPSGCGKTSLLEVIAGLERQARGRVRLGERVWLDSERGIYVPPERRDIGYVPQDGLLFPHLDVRRNLLAGAHRASGRGGARATLGSVCELLELGDLLGREVATLSGGERQRVALGRAICSGPQLLLLDEPLASLDLPLRRRVLPFLERVRRELDVPTILVSHDPAEVQTLCDRLVVLRDGTVVTSGVTREVLTDPRVFALSGGSFENLLPCRLDAVEDSAIRVRLGHDGAGVAVLAARGPGAAADSRTPLFVAFPAHEVIIALSRPQGISARNLLPARIEAITAVDSDRLVTATLTGDGSPVTAQITADACDSLGLELRAEVWLIIKTAACRLIGGEPTPVGGDSPRTRC